LQWHFAMVIFRWDGQALVGVGNNRLDELASLVFSW